MSIIVLIKFTVIWRVNILLGVLFVAYKDSKDIVESVEELVVGWSVGTGMKGNIKRNLLYPGKLLLKGLEIWLKDFFVFIVFVVIGMAGVGLFYGHMIHGVVIPIAGDLLLNILSFIVVIYAVIISAFAVPSQYSYGDVEEQHVKDVTEMLGSKGRLSERQILAVRENISGYDKRVRVRLINLRLFVALCWSGFIYLNGQLNVAESTALKDSSLEVSMWMLLFFIVPGMYCAIESYSKVMNKIFRTALIGCNEYLYMDVESKD